MVKVHSEKAKSATRKQVDGWIRVIENSIKSKEKELAKFRVLAPKTPTDWDNKMIPILEEALQKTKKQLQECLNLKQEYEKDGLI